MIGARGAARCARGAIIVSATKGLEADTLLRMSEVIAQEAGPAHPVVVLSGPSFAVEVARQLPTAVLAASRDARGDGSRAGASSAEPYFRLYGSDDVVGVEIGGALKNVIAIAAGVVEGMGLGHNALAGADHARPRRDHAAGVRRGRPPRDARRAERARRSRADVHRRSLSRNRHVGIELARGRSLPDILAGMKMVAEGVRTTGAALALGARYGVELPIATQMAEVLAGRTDVRAALGALMLRPQRAEAEPTTALRISDRWVISSTSIRDGLCAHERADRRPLRRDRRAAPTRPSGASRPVDVETIEALEELLISADIGVAATERIIDAVKDARAQRRRACATSSRRRSAASSPPSSSRCPTAAGRT